ncbi:MAG: zinc-dependent alcohol dehydrogenase family protein [Armatimonadota bacterium]|nr:zinc-dependent alcohol dehydrogenase family protein [Armatimonadota bacterium]MDR7404564.1 zinc-dependent alcohol dehydrogenase family protein [Armatimonadota bacterium]
MRAVVLTAPGPIDSARLEMREVPVPEPGPGQVRVRVRRCGVCHTDLHIAEGDLPPVRLPVVLGHQVVGVVDRLGPGVTAPAPGTRVGVAWVGGTCGVCAHCRRGEENLCEDLVFTGYHQDGGYADYLIARADFVYPLPDGFDDDRAAPLLCAGIIGYRSLRVSGVQPGERLGLFGFGASAHLAIQVARHWGCEVYVFTRSPARRRLAEDLGAAWVGGPDDVPPAELDAAVVFAPSGRVVVEALRRLRRGGTVAINAVYLDPLPPLDYRLLYWERAVRSVSNSTRRDGREFLELAARIPVRVDVQTFSLPEASRALVALKRGEITGAAVLVVEG